MSFWRQSALHQNRTTTWIHIVAFAILGGAIPAAAEDGPTLELVAEEEATHGERHRQFKNLVGVRVGGLGLLVPEGGVLTLGGGAYLGVSIERSLIHELLEIEISAPISVAYAEEHLLVSFPVDLHVKFPLHFHSHFSGYLAAGPVIDLVVLPELALFPGLSFATGVYCYYNENIGLDVEVDYNVVFESGNIVHEVLFAVGPVLRF